MLCRLTIKGEVIEVTAQARPAQLQNWLRELRATYPNAHADIKAFIHNFLDRHNTATARDIAVAGPGDRWHNVFHPIYDCLDYGGDPEETYPNAAKFLGLILWEVMLERNDEWHFTKYPKELENEDYYVTHYYSVPRYIHRNIAERQGEKLRQHGRSSPGIEDLARQLTEKWRDR